MKYVYYDPNTMQVMAEFASENLSINANCVARGFSRGIVPPGVTVTRDHCITGIGNDELILTCGPSVNPEQPTPTPRTRIDDLNDKLAADTITDQEIRELLRLERNL